MGNRTVSFAPAAIVYVTRLTRAKLPSAFLCQDVWRLQFPLVSIDTTRSRRAQSANRLRAIVNGKDLGVVGRALPAAA